MNTLRHIDLAYGRGWLPISLPSHRVDVILPTELPALPDERTAILQALDAPRYSPSLRSQLALDAKICIIFTDITRATPNERMIPWLLEYLAEAGVHRDQITLLNSTGTHRGNTTEELSLMLTPEVVRDYRIVNHECHDHESLCQVGFTRTGTPALINRIAVEADVRIVTGFIEPHFFAGFSGGPKGLMPGVAGLETVVSNHGTANIGDARARFGVTVGNPLWEELRDIALQVGSSFLLNVTLNDHRQITGVFAGDLIKAHTEGTEFVRAGAMQRVERHYEVVVTTNSGYPLDMNLYQGVKGMRAGAQILAKNGVIVLAAECCEGLPAASPHEELLLSESTPEALLARINSPGFAWPEQWAAHIQTLIQQQAEVHLYSAMSPETVRAVHLIPCHDIAATVEQALARFGPEARVAVLPLGPLTIPYIA